MSYLIDTNIISEIRKGARCDTHVSAWYASIADEDIPWTAGRLPKDCCKRSALMKSFERITGAATVFVLSAATAAADCPMQSYTCDNRISANLMACRNPFPRIMWADVFQTNPGGRYTMYRDEQLTEQAPSGPQTTYSNSRLMVVTTAGNVRLASASRDGPRFFCELHVFAAVSCGKGLSAAKRIIHAAQSVWAGNLCLI